MTKINFKEFGKALLLVVSYIVIIPNLIALIFHVFGFSLKDQNVYILANLLVYLIIFSILLFLYRKSLVEDFKKFKADFKNHLKVGAAYWLQAFVFMIICNLIIVSLAGGIASNEEANRTFLMANPIFSIISMCILGPILEELLFRKGFRDAFADSKVFLIVSSLLFGGAHLLSAFTTGSVSDSIFQLLFIIPYSGIGYFFGKAYLKTDTIYTSFLMHMFHNSLSVLLVFLSSLGV